MGSMTSKNRVIVEESVLGGGVRSQFLIAALRYLRALGHSGSCAGPKGLRALISVQRVKEPGA